MEELSWPVSPVSRGLRLLGLWTPPPGRRCGQRLVLCWVLLSLACLVATGAACLLMDTPDDLPQLSLTAYTTITIFGLFAKLVSFSLDGARLTRMLQLLAECRVRFPDTRGRRGQHHAMAVRLHRFLQVSYRVNSVMWMFAPIVSVVKAARSRGDGPPVKRTYVLPLWLPFDTQSSPAYEVVYVVHLAAGWTLSETTVLVDGALLALMLHAAAELAVLNDGLCDDIPAGETDHEVVALAEEPGVTLGHPTDETVASREIRQERMFRHLVKNIQHHQVIIICVGVLQKLLSRATSVLLFCNTIAICCQIMATAVLVQEEVEIIQTVKMLMSTSLYAYQGALFCLLGQKIINESERLPRSAFGGGWPDADVRCWRLVLAISRYSSRALCLRVCGLYTLSRETLLQILNVSYSLFNFMYQTDKGGASRQ